MRKAFDANVPKFRPRLKGATVSDAAPEQQMPAAPDAVATPEPAAVIEAAATPVPEASEPVEPASPREEIAPDSRAHLANEGVPPPLAPSAAAPEAPRNRGAEPAAFAEAPDVQARRERLEEIKRKVVAAARPAPPMPALPETPARAGESALALVRDLEAQLHRAREVELALRADLDQARTEMARGAAEGRRAAERLTAVEQQVEEKRAVLQEMLSEMGALEDERDGAVGRAQALAALDEERQTLLDKLSGRAEQAEKARAEAEAEVQRLGDELDDRASDAVRLRSALAEVTRERDDLARELAQTKRERDELSDARQALEQVHEALATARARLG
jgi:DNA repair exonuclease SbcCD ATPase subunit